MKFTQTLYRSGAIAIVAFLTCKYSDLPDLSNRIKCALYKKAYRNEKTKIWKKNSDLQYHFILKIHSFLNDKHLNICLQAINSLRETRYQKLKYQQPLSNEGHFDFIFKSLNVQMSGKRYFSKNQLTTFSRTCA